MNKIKFVILIFILFLVNNKGQTKYKFPQDHYAHKGYHTEWWYYNGHLKSKDKKFGYELVFFKVEPTENKNIKTKDFKAKNIYMAHFAISDINNKKFFYIEKINRPFGKIAGASTKSYNLWNERFSAIIEDGYHILKAKYKGYEINLRLKSLKKPIIHGKNQISIKGKEKNNFSYYYSLTRLKTEGIIKINGKKYKSKGISWMDHEWMNNRVYEKNNKNWDWFSIQLNNKIEIMFYLIKDANNKIKQASSGTIIYQNGSSRYLTLKETNIKAIKYWRSKKSNSKYPISWHFSIPSEKIDLKINAKINNQELISNFTKINYWEGACNVEGKYKNKKISGQSYIEMTGYRK